jgi:hypothetical protein
MTKHYRFLIWGLLSVRLSGSQAAQAQDDRPLVLALSVDGPVTPAMLPSTWNAY